jgi:hypothetical protein
MGLWGNIQTVERESYSGSGKRQARRCMAGFFAFSGKNEPFDVKRGLQKTVTH